MGEAIFAKYSKMKPINYVPNAGYAVNANLAKYANNAIYANNAGYATSAGSATKATNATFANNARYATSAGSATSATTAVNANRANYANVLVTSRTIGVNLSSSTNATFNGSASIYPGVYGVLPVTKGGTGVNSLANLKNLITTSGSIGGVWKEINNFNTPGNYTFTAPDLFGGKDYTIGVVVISAGQYGEKGIYNYHNNMTAGSINSRYSIGGLAGNLISFIQVVKPGNTYPIVVANALNTAISSSFNKITGGSIVSATQQLNGSEWYNEGGFDPFIGRNRLFSGDSAGNTGTSLNGKTMHVRLGRDYVSKLGGGNSLRNVTLASNTNYATTFFNAQNATLPGCGGGAIYIAYNTAANTVINNFRVNPGHGGNGCVIIYAATGL